MADDGNKSKNQIQISKKNGKTRSSTSLKLLVLVAMSGTPARNLRAIPDK